MERDASPSHREVRKSRREMVVLFRRFMLRQGGRQELERLEQFFQTAIQRDTAAVAALVRANEQLVIEHTRIRELESSCRAAETRAASVDERIAELTGREREFEALEHLLRTKHDEREQSLIAALTQANTDHVTLARRLDLAHEQSVQTTQQIVTVEREAAERESALRAEAAQAAESLAKQLHDFQSAAGEREATLHAEWSQRLVDLEARARTDRDHDAQRIASLRQRLATSEFRLAMVRHRLGWMWRAGILARRMVQQWLGRGDAWNTVQSTYGQLKEDTVLFTPSRRGVRLQPSDDVRTVPYVSYSLNLRRRNLCGVQLAAVVDEPHTAGSLCVEIVSQNQIVTQAAVPLAEIREGVPVSFRFPAISATATEPVELRVFVRDASTGVRVFELRRWTWGGLGRLVRHPFASYLFSEGTDR
ncbi:MAG: hypothetical protein HZA46_04065 [Planctomycetales bacterium]|nr:hypothetical protein [Planctomycetales bacterium]